ncbi:MAG: MATE family efflux transporter [Blautia sp.]
MPMNGLGQAAIPVVGYNYGAGKPERVRAVYRTAIPIAAGIALLATVIFCAVPHLLLGLFDADAEMLRLGVSALRIISITFVFAAVTMILGYAASGLGNGFINMVSTGLRQVVILVPLVWILERYAGISCVWYAFWMAESVATVCAIFSSIRLLHKRLPMLKYDEKK